MGLGIRLTFAGRDGMTGNRGELPRSSVAGHRSVPHRGFEGSPCGWTHPLLETERLGVRCCGVVARSRSPRRSRRARARRRRRSSAAVCRGRPSVASVGRGVAGSARRAQRRRRPGRVGGGRAGSRPSAGGARARPTRPAVEVQSRALRGSRYGTAKRPAAPARAPRPRPRASAGGAAGAFR